MTEKRHYPRIAVPARVPLRCEITHGAHTFEATVVDISLGGIGTLVYDAAIRMDPGVRIAGARIVHPHREPMALDLEVRHIATIALEEGGAANRAGCRFFGTPRDIEALVRLFLAELGE